MPMLGGMTNMNDTVKTAISGIITVAMLVGFGFGAGYIYRGNYNVSLDEACWNTLSDIKFEYWFQEDKQRKIDSGEPLDDIYSQEVIHPCVGYHPWPDSDITYYRAMTREELYAETEKQLSDKN
jgi:hypothetical protein